jgi:hypothetical protein
VIDFQMNVPVLPDPTGPISSTGDAQLWKALAATGPGGDQGRKIVWSMFTARW